MPELVLLHPPSIYDFREKIVMLGPISGVIPSSPIFEAYPIGFISILNYLQSHGYKVRILNLALKMLANRRFNAEKAIKSLSPLAFGIDLHWLAHVQGALELTKIVKKWHPDTSVILGGLSATYFHTEIMKEYPQVNYIVRGDSAEEPLLRLMERIERGKQPDDVPNITWRSPDNKIRMNDVTFVPENLDDYTLDYGVLIKSAARDLDPEGYLQYPDWFKYPLAALLTSKGCIYNCVTCGGSRHAYAKSCARSKMALKDPVRLVEEMRIIEDYVKGPIFLLNDIRMGGADHVQKLLDEIRREKVDNPLIIELFEPADRKFLEDVAKACSEASLEISPESHSEQVRRSFGRAYSNNELEKTLADAGELGYKRIDVFFMIGLPYQDRESVLKTVQYAEALIGRHESQGRLHPFIAPLAPFLDPGSLAFENPNLYGYQLFFNSIAEHKKALEGPSWKYFLNYQTSWMCRDEIVSSTYDAAALLNEARAKYGLVDEKDAHRLAERLNLARIVTEKTDETMKNRDELVRNERISALRQEIEAANGAILCHRDELLKWPLKSNIDVRLRIAYALIKHCLGR